jgi:hypothetical protein
VKLPREKIFLHSIFFRKSEKVPRTFVRTFVKNSFQRHNARAGAAPLTKSITHLLNMKHFFF